MRQPLDWTDRGRELGATLDACSAVVVVGADSAATVEVALGLARQQAQTRRVAVADLIGDVPSLYELVGGDDTHGIVDSFVFGVSLSKVAHPVAGTPNLFVIPSGSAPIDHEEILPNPRWGRLAVGFHEAGALMVLVAPFDAPRLRDLVEFTDGLVIVGDSAPSDIPVARALAWLRPRRQPAAAPREAPLAVVTSQAAPAARGRWLTGLGGIAVALVIAALLFWFARRPFAGKAPERAVYAPKPSASTAPMLRDTQPTSILVVPDTVTRDTLAPADTTPMLAVSNPADSAQAARWSVRLEQTNTRSAAILDLRVRFESVPAGTYGIDLRTRYLLLVAGAYPTRAGAESLLVQLHDHRVLASDNGSVVSLPFAFLVQQGVPLVDVPQRLNQFAKRGHIVYALRQANGAENLYYGAYESREQAALAVPGVRDAGVTPTLVYRIGRVY